MRTLALLTLLCLAVTACEALSVGEILALTDMKSEWAVSGWDAAPSAACGNWRGIYCLDGHVTRVYVFLFKDNSRSQFLYLSTEECLCVYARMYLSFFPPDISTFILKHAVNIVTNRYLNNNGLTGSIDPVVTGIFDKLAILVSTFLFLVDITTVSFDFPLSRELCCLVPFVHPLVYLSMQVTV
jgi:hypothetical protein